ncbi:MAG: hypothetical protein WC621_02960 [Patescibacteria group bacterium]
MDITYFNEKKTIAKNFFQSRNSIYNPYFETNIILNSDGLHHLQFSARRERNKKEQLLKFSLLPLAFKVIEKSGTVQEYRKSLIIIGKKSKRDGLSLTKEVQYWALVAIVGQKQIKIRVILRRVGDGNITFWSVMPYSKLKHGEPQKLYTDNIADE